MLNMSQPLTKVTKQIYKTYQYLSKKGIHTKRSAMMQTPIKYNA